LRAGRSRKLARLVGFANARRKRHEGAGRPDVRPETMEMTPGRPADYRRCRSWARSHGQRAKEILLPAAEPDLTLSPRLLPNTFPVKCAFA